MPDIDEPFRTIYCDPGEDFGFAVGKGTKLLFAGTEKMWLTVDDIFRAIMGEETILFQSGDNPLLRDEVDPSENVGPIGRVVCEDWKLYPEKLKFLAWDKCRTARAIGGIQLATRVGGIPMVLQPAAIKRRAEAGGAEELFYRPLHENRHQNDAIMHFVYYTQNELLAAHYTGLDNLPGPAEPVDE